MTRALHFYIVLVMFQPVQFLVPGVVTWIFLTLWYRATDVVRLGRFFRRHHDGIFECSVWATDILCRPVDTGSTSCASHYSRRVPAVRSIARHKLVEQHGLVCADSPYPCIRSGPPNTGVVFSPLALSPVVFALCACRMELCRRYPHRAWESQCVDYTCPRREQAER